MDKGKKKTKEFFSLKGIGSKNQFIVL